MVRGDRIYNLRVAKNYTLKELGDKIGVSASTVRKWENGLIETIRSDKIDKLSKALDVTPGYLLDWTDKPGFYTPQESEETTIKEYNQKTNISEPANFEVSENRDSANIICKRILRIRKSLQLTQEELANKIGVSRVTINNYERGVTMPKAAIIATMAAVLRINEDYITGKSEEPGRSLTPEDDPFKPKTLQETMAGQLHPLVEMHYSSLGDPRAIVEVNPEEKNPYRRVITEGQLREEELFLLQTFRSLDLRRRVELLHYAFDLESQKRAEDSKK